MTRGRWAAPVGLILSMMVVLVWVMPLLTGPRLHCIETDRPTCDEILRFTTVRGGLFHPESAGFEQFFPVTEVWIYEGGCSMTVERVYGLIAVSSIC